MSVHNLEKQRSSDVQITCGAMISIGGIRETHRTLPPAAFKVLMATSLVAPRSIKVEMDDSGNWLVA